MDDVPQVIVGGIRTAVASRKQLVSLMLRDCMAARKGGQTPKLIFDINGQGLAMALWDKAYRSAVSEADLIHADGQPIVMASRLFTKTPIPERSSTTDLFHDAAAAAQSNGLKFYLLGTSEEVNAACAKQMCELYPGLEIVGRRDGFFSAEEEEQICRDINEAGADVVWVGLGKPKEQQFCVRNSHRLRAGWLVTSGGCFNYVVGAYGRAPDFMQRAGLEWLFRIWGDPKKFFWRYLTTNPVALFLLLTRTRQDSPR